MLYFSSILKNSHVYKQTADNLFAALDSAGIAFHLLDGARDIWMRDFMPVQIRDGSFVSFRYEPSYLQDMPGRKTDYKRDVAPQFSFPIAYSDINLDGGNVVFSPSKEKAVLSDRIFTENPGSTQSGLIKNLERQIKADIILIPSLKSDMTGHADGMVRFVDEKYAIGNRVLSINGLEQRIKLALKKHGIEVIDFPYYASPKGSAVGCYLNFLETDSHIVFPVFDTAMDDEAIKVATSLFSKPVIPVNVNEIAKEGGVLNCISWETDEG